MISIRQKDRIQKNLLRWFKENARDLPWRRTQDPYAIWISEIMLQQTQVPTVIPYYRKFLKTFPTVRRLAEADLSDVLTIWEGLGYYSRARNLHRASQEILTRFRGRIPDGLDDLLSLPGIGRYTAGAILSIAYNKETPILDGNVKRVLSRLFAISENPADVKTGKLLWEISESLIPEGHAGSFNQALMDLGSMVCTPNAPLGPDCPIASFCKAKTQGNPEKYPMRQVRKKIPHIHAAAAVIQADRKVLITQRPPEGLLGGLWEFPNWKVDSKTNPGKQLAKWIAGEMGLRVRTEGPAVLLSQTFSHFKLTLHVYRCKAEGRNTAGRWVSLTRLNDFPMSRLHRKIAETLSLD